jgi:hypothetical protein
MAKLKPWYDVVGLREDLRENRPLDASEFAVHLDQIRDGRAPKDYTEPARFFDRTYITGSILELASQVGVYTAGAVGGLYAVRAEAVGHQAIAEVRVATEERPHDEEAVEAEEEVKPGKRTIRWRGAVPPQKWMNFYTKVLSRFTASPEMKLEMSFEVTLDREQAQSKADETRAGLKDLGLDDRLG